MHTYLFILGRNPALSVLELVSYFQRKGIVYELHHHTDTVALVHVPYVLDAALVINDLGGTVKIGKEIPSVQSIALTKNKLAYSVTAIESDTNHILSQLKTYFRKEKVMAVQRYSSFHSLPPKKSRQLDIEFVVFRKHIFQIVAVSHPGLYKKRDHVRPVFDPLRGTSIRLSKILINLAQAKRMILDPFCGTGTILQEALLMGYHVVGIDNKIRDATKNIQWLGDSYLSRARLIEGNAQRVASFLSSVEAVVTEPYLGPYMKNQLDRGAALVLARKLEQLYLVFLSGLFPILEGKVVMILPRFRTPSGSVALNVENILEGSKFRVYSPLPSISLPLLYRYKKSKIDRFIYILEKVQ